MTIRFICDGRGATRKAILERMAEVSGDRVECVLHFGERDADYHGGSLQSMIVRNGRRGHLMPATVARGMTVPLLAQPDFHEQLARAIDQMHRARDTYRYRSNNLQNLQDYIDWYHILADAMAQEIAASGATHALFMNMPHLAYDTILFQVARAMGLQTVILCQTTFPNLYFSMRTPEDMGAFDPTASTAPPMEIEKGSAPDLFFMPGEWQTTSEPGRITPKGVLSVLKHLAVRAPLKALNPVYVARTLRRVARIYRTLPKWRDPFASFFHTNELAYYEHLAEYERTEPDLDARFIYVPLHNQPEMSTSALGGLYRDQLLIIETLSRKLPEGWRIYVKENPRQGAFARGPMFFHRLMRIPGVTLVPSATNTYALSSKAQFVASVVGTAGWEAMRKGKPAVVFGNSWYKALPGAVLWSETLDLADVASRTFAHEDLEQAAGALIARCHPGVIETIYLNAIEGPFDAVANVDTVARDVVGLLTGDVPLTFDGRMPA